MATDGEMTTETKSTVHAAMGEDGREAPSKVQEKMGNPALMLSRDDVGLLGITAASVAYLGDPTSY